MRVKPDWIIIFTLFDPIPIFGMFVIVQLELIVKFPFMFIFEPPIIAGKLLERPPPLGIVVPPPVQLQFALTVTVLVAEAQALLAVNVYVVVVVTVETGFKTVVLESPVEGVHEYDVALEAVAFIVTLPVAQTERPDPALTVGVCVTVIVTVLVNGPHCVQLVFEVTV